MLPSATRLAQREAGGLVGQAACNAAQLIWPNRFWQISEAIFRRGVSTRNRATGGLGLHWCANAVKVMGGSIRAESDGPGLGATIILELPKYENKLKEAA